MSNAIRRFFSLSILLILLFTCGCQISFEKNSKSVNNPNLDDVEFWETDVVFALDNIDFPVFAEEIGLNIEEKPITSKEQAIALGKQIIDIRHKNNQLLDFELLSVGHSTSDNTYLFWYSLDQRDVDPMSLTDSYSFYAAVNGYTGEIIIMWVAE